MADFQIVVDNTWTYLRPNIEVNSSLIRRLESETSYTVEEYSRFRKTTVELDVSLFEREQLRYPTGLYSVIDRVLIECGYTFDVIDGREIPTINQPLQFHAKKLRDYQEEVVEAALKAQRGVIKVATGGGKTVIAAAIVAKLNTKTLFIVYSIDLLEQTADEFESMFHLKVGKIGGGYCDIKQINICTIQTLHCAFDLKYTAVDEESKINEKISKDIFERKEEIRKTVQEAELVICDECFHRYTNVHIDIDQQMTIEDIYNNELVTHVLSYNHKKKIFEKKKILRKIKLPLQNPWYKVKYKYDGKEHLIRCTANHKFWTKNRGYVEAKDLLPNDVLINTHKSTMMHYCRHCNTIEKPYHDEAIVISSTFSFSMGKNKIRKMSCYNLEVEDNHNYFANGVLVSNCHRQTAPTYIQMMKLMTGAYNRFSLCLYKNTKVLLADGRKCSIKSLYDCNKKRIINVMTYNIKKKILEPKLALIIRVSAKNKKLLKLVFRNEMGEIFEIICSSKHRFYVNEKEFKEANKLEIGETFNTVEKARKYKDKICQDLNLSYLVLRRPDITNDFQLKQKLSFLLFEDPIATLISKTEIENNENYLYDLSILDVEEENQNFFANNVLVHNSATPYRDSSIDRVLDAYSGKQICNISASFLIERKYLVAPKIYVLDPNEHSTYKFIKKSFRNIYEKWIVNNDDRNSMIVDSTQRLLDMQKSVLITVTRIPHGETLCEMLDKAGVKSIAFIRGEVDKIKRKELLNQIREKKLQVLVGSSLHYNECIWIRDHKGFISLIKIGQFVEQQLLNEKQEFYETLSFWKNKVCWKRITHVVKHERQIPVVRTKIGTGRVVEVTTNHSLITYDEQQNLKNVSPEVGNNVIATTVLPLDVKEPILKFDLVKEFLKIEHKSIEIVLKKDQPFFGVTLSQSCIREMKTEYRLMKDLIDKIGYRRAGIRLTKKCEENKNYKKFVIWYNENVRYKKGGYRVTLEKTLLLDDYLKLNANIFWIRSRKGFCLPLFLENSVELATICGLFIGDGSVNCSWRLYLIAKPNEHFKYKNEKSRKEKTIDLCVKCFNKIFPNLDVVITPNKRCAVGGQLIAKLFTEILGVNGKALTKEVPNYIFNSKKEIQIAFLYGYFLTDGSFDGDYKFTFGSVSKMLIDGVLGLLLNNGFKKIKYAVKPAATEEYNKKRREEAKETGRLCITSNNEAFIVCVNGELFKNKNMGRNPTHDSRAYLRNEVNNEFYVVPIIRSEEFDEIKSGKYVYDISVKDSENFFSGQGILCHNTVADEGIDLPSLGSAIMAGGGKSLIKSLQRVGRTLRPYPSAENNEKKEAIIVDFYDRLRYLTGHSKKRIKIYESEPKFQVFKHF